MSSSEHDGAGVSPETFQEIIRERKEEKKQGTEQRRLRDLKRIQDMKSKEGVNPVEIFPKEVWLLILDELHPEDRGNMWQLHDLFRGLMENSRIRDILLPQVLKFEVVPFWIKLEPESQEVGKKKQSLSNYLELRKVSKSMRNEVDRCIDNDLLALLRHGTYDHGAQLPQTISFILTVRSRDAIEKLDRLLASTETGLVPRLIGRSIFVELHILAKRRDDYDFLPLLEEFRGKMTQFLEKVGKQIWHFNFKATVWTERPASNKGIVKRYLAFLEWISKMPNLKWLQVSHYCNGSFRGKCRGLGLVDTLRSQTLPKLDKLERVDLKMNCAHSCCRDEVLAIRKTILGLNPHIKILNISSGALTGLEYALQEELPEAQLESIDFQWRIVFSNIDWINTNWPLRRMALSFDLRNDSINSLFQFLHKFPQLERLSLQVQQVTVGDVPIDFLKLPNLMHLELEIFPRLIPKNKGSIQFFFSLQFILYCENLKKLYWTISSWYAEQLKGILNDSENENMIDFEGGWEDLTNSNIWEVFPRLEYVKTSVKNIGYPLLIFEDREYHRE